jgi:hypothetical protein
VHPRWKIIGLAGVAGVAATGVVLARTQRARRDYDPDELRERLHRRLAEAAAIGGDSAEPTDEPVVNASRIRLRGRRQIAG